MDHVQYTLGNDIANLPTIIRSERLTCYDWGGQGCWLMGLMLLMLLVLRLPIFLFMCVCSLLNLYCFSHLQYWFSDVGDTAEHDDWSHHFHKSFFFFSFLFIIVIFFLTFLFSFLFLMLPLLPYFVMSLSSMLFFSPFFLFAFFLFSSLYPLHDYPEAFATSSSSSSVIRSNTDSCRIPPNTQTHSWGPSPPSSGATREKANLPPPPSGERSRLKESQHPSFFRRQEPPERELTPLFLLQETAGEGLIPREARAVKAEARVWWTCDGRPARLCQLLQHYLPPLGDVLSAERPHLRLSERQAHKQWDDWTRSVWKILRRTKSSEASDHIIYKDKVFLLVFTSSRQ